MFGHVPNEAASTYGDKNFQALMTAKIISVHLGFRLGYDVLFQDADVIWFQHPLQDYFAKPSIWNQEYDIIFQDDGARSLRFAPYNANSGFYFVRNNERTSAYMHELLFSMSIVLRSKSHQQVMIAILNEHVSLFGLRAKVVPRESPDLPCGYHWHRKPDVIRAAFKGEIHPIVVHMSWTENKDNKIKFYQQMGEWYFADKCIGKKRDEISSSSSDLVSTCCAAEPIFKCHYKDKPSLHPCDDSPAIDKKKNRTRTTNVTRKKRKT